MCQQVHILGEFGTNTPHVPGTAEPADAADPLSPADPARLHAPSPECHYSHEHNLDECDSLKKRQFDQRVEARISWINGSTYPIAQPPQPSSKGDPRHPLTWSVHRTMWGKAGRTYHLACQTKPTQGADQQLPQKE
jgi:hypothetical protein